MSNNKRFAIVATTSLLFMSNVLFGFPADVLIQKWNESKIVDKLYLSLQDSRLVDQKALDVPTLTQTASAADFSIQSGYYVGTGSSGRTISGVGFQPNLVMIKSSTSAGVMVFKTSAMPAANTAFSSAAADNTASNITFNSDGFTLGTLANVNSANVLYYWTAFSGSDCSSTGNFCVGTYAGNGSSPRTITTGFQPSFVIVKRSTAVAGHFRVASEPANETLFLTNAARDTAGNYIQSFSATGFTVGATDNANGGAYYYVAFKTTSGLMNQGTYTGNATDNRGITGVGFQANLVMVKNATASTSGNRSPIMNRSESYGDSSTYVGDATANLVNAVQALQSDGFQVGTAAQTNESGATLYWVALGGAPAYSASSTFQMDTGSYTGTGASLPVTGLGFEPDLVIIKDNAANYSVFRTGLMAGNSTGYLDNAVANFTGGVTSIDGDGFTVGTSAVVNTSSNTYHWQAFGNAFDPYDNTGAADFAIGAYYGNGIDSRNVTRLPFQPNMVTAKRNGASAGTFRTSATSGDLSSFFGATAEGANRIQALNSDGYQIGTNANVNTAANLYHWFAFKNGDNFTVGSYSGTGSAQNINAGFQPDLAWVKRSTAVAGVHRGASITGDTTQYFSNLANVSGRITGTACNVFSVGGSQTETNASGGTYRYAAWRVPIDYLGFDIVDASGCSVANPSYTMTAANFSFECTNAIGSLGSASQQLRITNPTQNPLWTLSAAATDGSSALWRNGGNTIQYDYNDSSGSPTGCQDGDSDNKAGQLTLDPTDATVTPKSGCTTSNVNAGSETAFSSGTSSIVLFSAVSGAPTGCYWDIAGIGITQSIPGGQPGGDPYSINLTLTITAN